MSDQEDGADTDCAFDTTAARGTLSSRGALGGGSLVKVVSAFATGQLLGERYEIRELLGSGGMGAVYRAVDRELGADVALKLVRSSATSLLRQEVRLAQKVTHPNVCRTYDLEMIDGHELVKMEYIAGETLAERLRRVKTLSIEETLAIARSVTSGLAAAHAVGIVHRDLKPGNVMLAAERVVLMDFGLAREDDDSGDLAGTPGYMSPEQLLGQQINDRSDLYALGCMVYEMLAGEPVFGSGNAYEVAARHAAAPIPDVRAKRPETPRWLARAVTRMLAKQPAERSDGLAALVRGPRRVAIPIAIAVGMIAAIGAVALSRSSSKPTWRPEEQPMPAYAENANGPAISPDGRTLLYIAAVEGSTSANIYAAGSDGKNPHPVLSPGIEPRSVRWSNDGNWFVYHTATGRMFRQHLIGGDVDKLGRREELGPGVFPAVCGNDLVFLDGNKLMITDGTTHRVLFTPRSGLHVYEPRCDRPGQRVVFGSGPRDMAFEGGELMMLDIARGVVTSVMTGRPALFPVFTPDGKAIVFTRRDLDGHLRLYEVVLATRAIHRLTFGNGPATSAEITPDGRRIIFNRDTTMRPLYVNRWIDGRLHREVVTNRLELLSYATPLITGGVLVVRHGDRENEIVLVSPDGKERELSPGALPIASLDGRRALLATGADESELVAVDLATNVRTVLATLPGAIRAGIESRDGIHLAIERHGAWQAWRVVAGSAEPEGRAGLIVPSPDGRARAIVTKSSTGYQLTIEGPGGATELPPRRVDAPRVTWLDGHRLAFYAEDAFHVVSPGSDEVVIAAPASEPRLREEQVLAPDGVRWYNTPFVGQVSRHVVVNYGDRAWR